MKNLTGKIVGEIFSMLQSFKTELHQLSELTLHQMFALITLKKNKKLTVGEVAKFFNTSIPSATVLIGRLYQMKLVKRRVDGKDRRKTFISLTEKGEGELMKARKEREEIMKRRMSKLTVKDQVQLLKIMQKIND